MKAISLMQPWAWMMTHGLPGIPMKDIENRKWATSFRGTCLVHASKTFDFEGLSFIEDKLEGLGFEPGEVLPEKYQMGGIVGMFTITDCVRQSKSPWFFGPYGFVVKDQHPLPFYPLRGQLNFFEVSREVCNEIILDKSLPTSEYVPQGQLKLF
jgi:hypothetical protein